MKLLAKCKEMPIVVNAKRDEEFNGMMNYL